MSNEITINKVEKWFASAVAAITGINLLYIIYLGPLLTNTIIYRTSPSMVSELKGWEMVSLLLIIPSLFLGSYGNIKDRLYTKYCFSFTGIYLLYAGFGYAFAMLEFGIYDGNSENYFFLFWEILLGGVIIISSGYSELSKDPSIHFQRKYVIITSIFFTIFLLLLSSMWVSLIIQVLRNGVTDNPEIYTPHRLGFWFVKYIDLSFVFPLGFYSIYRLIFKPTSSYPILITLFGFFTSMITAVLSMIILQKIDNNPTFQISNLIIFTIFTVIVWISTFVLINSKEKFI